MRNLQSGIFCDWVLHESKYLHRHFEYLKIFSLPFKSKHLFCIPIARLIWDFIWQIKHFKVKLIFTELWTIGLLSEDKYLTRSNAKSWASTAKFQVKILLKTISNVALNDPPRFMAQASWRFWKFFTNASLNPS